MDDVIYLRNSDSQTSDIYHSSYPLVLLCKTSGKEHPSTSKQHTKECSSVKMNEDLYFLNLMVDFSHIAQHTLVQKPAHGTGVVSLAPYSNYYILFCFFDMQRGSMLMISSSFFPNQLQLYNLHWQSFYSASSERHFHGRSWSSTRPLTGTDGL